MTRVRAYSYSLFCRHLAYDHKQEVRALVLCTRDVCSKVRYSNMYPYSLNLPTHVKNGVVLLLVVCPHFQRRALRRHTRVHPTVVLKHGTDCARGRFQAPWALVRPSGSAVAMPCNIEKARTRQQNVLHEQKRGEIICGGILCYCSTTVCGFRLDADQIAIGPPVHLPPTLPSYVRASVLSPGGVLSG